MNKFCLSINENYYNFLSLGQMFVLKIQKCASDDGADLTTASDYKLMRYSINQRPYFIII
jgi:hypothetical protein